MGNKTSAEKWMLRARSNLWIAKMGKSHECIVYDDLGNNCLAAAEKALKAYFIFLNGPKDLPWMEDKNRKHGHDLPWLTDLLKNQNVVIPEDIKSAVNSFFITGGWSYPWSYPVSFGFATKTKLTDYAVDRRYPGSYESLGKDGYRVALSRAEKIVSWVEDSLKE
jgi:HEPN domain-containing protein